MSSPLTRPRSLVPAVLFAVGALAGCQSPPPPVAVEHRPLYVDPTAAEDWTSLGGAMVGSPDACSFAPGRLDVVARGIDNALWHRAYGGSTGWAAWERVGDPIDSDPTCVAVGPGHLAVFARDTVSRRLVERHLVGNQWQPPTLRFGAARSGPDAVSTGGGTIDVAWVSDLDGKIHRAHFDGALWSLDEAIAATSSADVTLAATGRGLELWLRKNGNGGLAHLFNPDRNGAPGMWGPLHEHGWTYQGGPDAAGFPDGSTNLDIALRDGASGQIFLRHASGADELTDNVVVSEPLASDPSLVLYRKASDAALYFDALFARNVQGQIVYRMIPANFFGLSGQGLAGWPMRGHDPLHRALSDDFGPTSGLVKWQLSTNVEWTGDNGDAPAVAANGSVYVMGKQGGQTALFALTPNGGIAWSVGVPGAFAVGGVSLGIDGTVYFASADGAMRAVTQNGVYRWHVPTGAAILHAPAIGPDGMTYFGSTSGTFYAVDPLGRVAWTFGGAFGHAQPALAGDGTIYVGTEDGRLHARNADGSMKWLYDSQGGLPLGSPAIGRDGSVYVGSGNGRLVALDPATGAVRWSFQAAAITGDLALGSDGTIFFGAADENLYAVASNGLLRWSRALADSGAMPRGSLRGTPAIDADGRIYVSHQSHAPGVPSRLYVFAPDGKKLWTFAPADSRGLGGLAIGGDNMTGYLVNTEGGPGHTSVWAIGSCGPDPRQCARTDCAALLRTNGVPAESLVEVLNQCPQLADHIAMTDELDAPYPYAQWSDGDRARLDELYQKLVAGVPLDVQCPDTAQQLNGAVLYYYANQARDIYLAHVAHVFFIEAMARVPWSVLTLPTASLAEMLGSKELFASVQPSANPPENFRFDVVQTGFQGAFRGSTEYVCDPDLGYRFMSGQLTVYRKNLIGVDRLTTLRNLTLWFAENAGHGAEPKAGWAATAELGDRMMAQQNGRGVVTIEGCHGASNLFFDLARSVNLPIVPVSALAEPVALPAPPSPGHFASFTHAGMVYAWQEPDERIVWHTDDLYAMGNRTWQPIDGNGQRLDFDQAVQVFFDATWKRRADLQAIGFDLDPALPWVIPGVGYGAYSAGAWETLPNFGRFLGVWPSLAYNDRDYYETGYALCRWQQYLSEYCAGSLGATLAGATPGNGFVPAHTTQEHYDHAAACLAGTSCNAVEAAAKSFYDNVWGVDAVLHR